MHGVWEGLSQLLGSLGDTGQGGRKAAFKSWFCRYLLDLDKALALQTSLCLSVKWVSSDSLGRLWSL